MGLIKNIRSYAEFENREFARRKARREKIKPYKSLSKNKPMKKVKRKITLSNVNNALGNPYGVKIPSAKKIVKKHKKKKKKGKKQKVIIIYK